MSQTIPATQPIIAAVALPAPAPASTAAPAPAPVKRKSCFARCLSEFPFEAAAYAIAAMAVRVFSRALSLPLAGISIGLLGGKLVLKAMDRYNQKTLVHVTKEAHQFNKNHPYVQLIGFVFALAMSTLSPAVALVAGLSFGGYQAILLDVESYKRMQQSNRTSGL